MLSPFATHQTARIPGLPTSWIPPIFYAVSGESGHVVPEDHPEKFQVCAFLFGWIGIRFSPVVSQPGWSFISVEHLEINDPFKEWEFPHALALHGFVRTDNRSAQRFAFDGTKFHVEGQTREDLMLCLLVRPFPFSPQFEN